MRVLLTNHSLDERAGSELYLRDVALALLARGHEPLAYSRHLGTVAGELRRATVPVLDDLESLTTPPDLIHAQHHLEAMTALSRFPGVPAIYVCHGWLPDAEAPPDHPRILRYVAVDELVRRRLIDECGIAPERVVTHLNFVDLERFAERSEPLPERPTRALVFSNQLHDGNGLATLRRACERRDIALDVVGRAVGNVAEAPETLLQGYDLVFAKARAAMEAAASGCAVILCDAAGLGPMVSTLNLPDLRALNFGVRLLRRPIRGHTVPEALEHYDADDAQAVARQMRREAGLAPAVERLIELYEAVLDEGSEREVDADAEWRAVTRYFRHGPLTGGDFFQRERSALQAELGKAGDWARALQASSEATHRALDELRSEHLDLGGDLQTRDREIWLLKQQLERGQAEKQEELRAHREEIDRLRAIADDREQGLLALQEEHGKISRELSWMQASATWRWRTKLLGLRGLKRIYGALRRS